MLTMMLHGTSNMSYRTNVAIGVLRAENRNSLLIQRIPVLHTKTDRGLQFRQKVGMVLLVLNLGPIELGSLMWDLDQLGFWHAGLLEILGPEISQQLPQMSPHAIQL